MASGRFAGRGTRSRRRRDPRQSTLVASERYRGVAVCHRITNHRVASRERHSPPPAVLWRTPTQVVNAPESKRHATVPTTPPAMFALVKPDGLEQPYPAPASDHFWPSAEPSTSSAIPANPTTVTTNDQTDKDLAGDDGPAEAAAVPNDGDSDSSVDACDPDSKDAFCDILTSYMCKRNIVVSKHRTTRFWFFLMCFAHCPHWYYFSRDSEKIVQRSLIVVLRR